MTGSSNVILKVKGLSKTFRTGFLGRGNVIVAVDDVSFDVKEGEVVALIGESGSGKTTTIRLILRLLKPTTGRIYYQDKDILEIPSKEYWKDVQAIFQDPYASFNPFYKVDRILRNVFKLFKDEVSKDERRRRIRHVLGQVDLDPNEVLGKRTFELSGGQMQRVLLARSLLVDSRVIIADEPTSMIDASMRVSVLNLLKELSEKHGKSVMFISHDISQSFYLSDRVLVMYKGKLVEEGPTEEVLLSPQHEYTKRLISDVPKLHERFAFSMRA